MKNKRAGATKTSCSLPEAKTSPPSESPVKKRIRRTSARSSTIKSGVVLFETPLRSKWRPCYEEEGSNVSIQADEANDIDEEDEEINRKFASTLSFVDNGETVVGDTDDSRGAAKQAEKGFATSDNSDDEFVDSAAEENQHVMKYVHDLEKENTLLKKRMFSLNESATMEIKILKATIAELNAKLLSSSICTINSPAGTESMGSTNDVNENNYEQKKRINKEIATVSKALSGVIHNFVMTSDLTANCQCILHTNKRRFSRRRLAGIVVESVFALEWLRSKLAEISSTNGPDSNKKEKMYFQRQAQPSSISDQRQQ